MNNVTIDILDKMTRLYDITEEEKNTIISIFETLWLSIVYDSEKKTYLFYDGDNEEYKDDLYSDEKDVFRAIFDELWYYIFMQFGYEDFESVTDKDYNWYEVCVLWDVRSIGIKTNFINDYQRAEIGKNLQILVYKEI